jgi:hypothetical protein
MRNFRAPGALYTSVVRFQVGAAKEPAMGAIHLRRRSRARPDWLPHPLVLNVIVALWAAAAALQIAQWPHI